MPTRTLNLKEIQVGEHEQRFSMEDEGICELSKSIKQDGLIQALIVTETNGKFVLVSGHRRFAALARAQIFEAECKVIETDELQASRITFAENFFRTDLSAVELAVAIAKEYETGRMTVTEMADGFKRTEDWVKRQIAVTTWPEEVLTIIHTGQVSLSAGANLALVTDEPYRVLLCAYAADNGASARTTSAWLQSWRASQPADVAIEADPVDGPGSVVPLAPQAPCLACGIPFRTDQLCYVPFCVECVTAIRDTAKRPQV